MYILCKNGNRLVNSNNVTNFYIKQFYVPTTQLKTISWDIRAEYAVPKDNEALYDVVASYQSEDECRDNFNKLIHALIEERQFYNFLKEEY